jgi:phage terminase large subunit-like protein
VADKFDPNEIHWVEGKLSIGDIEEFLPDCQTDSKLNELNRLQRLASLLETYREVASESGVDKWFVPGTPFSLDNCPKHNAFFKAGSIYNERTFMAGNRCGKSIAGAYEASIHATGNYPIWWAGRTFDKPTNGWAVGSTARATRDTAQKELLGPIGAFGTGMIPRDLIGRAWSLSGVPQGIDVIQVKHVSGGWSTIGFKNYEQPLAAFYGTALDWAWLDEECPQDIYNEILIRTMTTNGLVFNTFTPLKGLTPQVVRFLEQADYLAGAKKILSLPSDEQKGDTDGEDGRLMGLVSHKAVIQAGWDDAPWLTEESKEKMLADTPPHLREARRLGMPAMGSGNVYPISLESLLVEPFPIPSYFKKLYALDVGWNRTAALWAAIDPQTDIMYIIDEHYLAECPPPIHAASIRARGQWIPGVIDPASRGRSQADGTQLMQNYKELGLQVTPAVNAVDAGIQAVWQRMSCSTLKVFNTLPNFCKEFVLYRRDEKGRIIKEHDHLMDCLRYLQNNINRAKSLDQMRTTPKYSGPTHYNI